MPTRAEDEWGKLYRRADLPKEDHERLVAELRANPGLLRNLLRQTSQEDDSLSAALLFSETESDDQEALDEKLRRYLLRDRALTQEDIAQIEESLVADERYFDRMLLVENELSEDYLCGALTAEEEQTFNDYFLTTPERREKLRYLQALLTAAPLTPREKIKRTTTALATSSSSWQSLLAFVRPANLRAAALTAVVILLLTFGALLWLTRQANDNEPLRAELPSAAMPQNTRLPSSDNQDNSSGLLETVNISSPASQNAQSPKTAPPASPPTVFALVPGVLRDGGVGIEKRIAPGSETIELNLRLNDSDYSVVIRDSKGREVAQRPRYRDFLVVLQDSKGGEVARRRRLDFSITAGRPTIVVSFPAALFKQDDYMVILSGARYAMEPAILRGGKDSEYKEVNRYSFRILK